MKNHADIVIHYRSDEEGAKKTLEELKKMGHSGIAEYADFSQTKEIESFFNKAVDFLGQVDILVNNAAGYDTQPFLGLNLGKFELLLKIGVSAPMFLIQLASKQMIQKKISGSIINISSISGNRPYPNRVVHSTAKAALNMLTQNTALELAQYGIRVNAIAPGPISSDDASVEVRVENIPLGRVGTPENQAFAALFLASQDSSWMTGQIITVDGGQSLSF